MTDDPADLSHLADIMVPPPVSWWPPAPGWWILGGTLVGVLAILAWSAILRYRRNAYRHAALAELAAIGPVEGPEQAAAVSAILKRVALLAYPRSDVASLTGSAWLAFLDHAASTTDFTRGPASGLVQSTFGGPPGDGKAVLSAAQRFIKDHRADT